MDYKNLKWKKQKLWLAFFVMLIFLNFPLLSIFNRPYIWGGLPLLYAYIFMVWGFVIFFTFWIVEKPFKRKEK